MTIIPKHTILMPTGRYHYSKKAIKQSCFHAGTRKTVGSTDPEIEYSPKKGKVTREQGYYSCA